MDFVGSVGGVEFPGGKAEDYPLELGSGSFIPGFEDQVDRHQGRRRAIVKVTFPADYGSEDLAGKDAEFKMTAKEIKALAQQPIDELLATAVGLENLAALRPDRPRPDRTRLFGHRAPEAEAPIARRLAERHKFTVPQGMVDIEVDAIWRQYQAQVERAKQSGTEPAEPPKDEAAVKAEYKDIAERRVRLGLVLAKSAARTISTSPRKRLTARSARRRGASPARSGMSPSTIATIPARSTACVRRFMRTKLSTSSSNSLRSPTSRYRSRNC